MKKEKKIKKALIITKCDIIKVIKDKNIDKRTMARAMSASQLTTYRDSLMKFRLSRDMAYVNRWVWLPKIETEILMLDDAIKKCNLIRHEIKNK
jgi:hypothetical protein